MNSFASSHLHGMGGKYKQETVSLDENKALFILVGLGLALLCTYDRTDKRKKEQLKGASTKKSKTTNKCTK